MGDGVRVNRFGYQPKEDLTVFTNSRPLDYSEFRFRR